MRLTTYGREEAETPEQFDCEQQLRLVNPFHLDKPAKTARPVVDSSCMCDRAIALGTSEPTRNRERRPQRDKCEMQGAPSVADRAEPQPKQWRVRPNVAREVGRSSDACTRAISFAQGGVRRWRTANGER